MRFIGVFFIIAFVGAILFGNPADTGYTNLPNMQGPISPIEQRITESIAAFVRAPQLPDSSFPVVTTEALALDSEGQSLPPEAYDAILAEKHSPAAGTGRQWYEAGTEFQIDAIYAFAMFDVESSLGTATEWYPEGKNTGNIVCASGYFQAGCHGRFGIYANWNDGIRAHMKLLSDYRSGNNATSRKLVDLRDVINTWAPPEDHNDVNAYYTVVSSDVKAWRQMYAHRTEISSGSRHEVIKDQSAHINQNARFATVNCDAWGNQPGCQHLGVDICGLRYDPLVGACSGGQGETVYAPYAGTYVALGEYRPGDPACPRCAGQYQIYVLDDGSKLYFGHLQNAVIFQTGQRIHAGDRLAEVSELAHTHVQLTNPDGSLGDFEAYYNRHP